MIHVDPRSIVRILATGQDNMGSVAEKGSICRFSLPGNDPWVLLSVRAIFKGGSGTATLTMRFDHPDDTEHYDFVEREWLLVGTGDRKNIQTVILPDDWALFTYQPQGRLVFEWTNPDAGNMRWALQVGMGRAS